MSDLVAKWFILLFVVIVWALFVSNCLACGYGEEEEEIAVEMILIK